MLSNSPAASLPGAESDTARDEGGNAGAPTYTPLDQELRIEELVSASDESPLRGKGKKVAHTTKPSSGKSSTMKNTTKTTERRFSGEKAATKSTSRSTNKENGAKPVAQRTGTAATTKNLLAGKGGARRVPIGSADAAPIGPAWK